MEKLFTLAVLLFAALGVYISWKFVQDQGWNSAWLLLSGKIAEQREKLPDPPAALGAFPFLNKLWA